MGYGTNRAEQEETKKRRVNADPFKHTLADCSLLQRGKHVETVGVAVHFETDWLVGSVTRYRDSDKKDGTTNQLFLDPLAVQAVRHDATPTNVEPSELKIPRHRVRRRRRRRRRL